MGQSPPSSSFPICSLTTQLSKYREVSKVKISTPSLSVGSRYSRLKASAKKKGGVVCKSFSTKNRQGLEYIEQTSMEKSERVRTESGENEEV